MKRSTHTLAVQSQNWLTHALLSLLVKKPLQDITICELCKKADVSRRTFYRNFESKEDVLHLYFVNLQQSYIEVLKTIHDVDFQALASSYFTFWSKHMDFLLAAKCDSSLFTMLLDVLNSFIPHLYEHASLSQSPLPYDIHFIIGGFQNVLITWITHDCQESVDEIILMISQMFTDQISFLPSEGRSKQEY